MYCFYRHERAAFDNKAVVTEQTMETLKSSVIAVVDEEIHNNGLMQIKKSGQCKSNLVGI